MQQVKSIFDDTFVYFCHLLTASHQSRDRDCQKVSKTTSTVAVGFGGGIVVGTEWTGLTAQKVHFHWSGHFYNWRIIKLQVQGDKHFAWIVFVLLVTRSSVAFHGPPPRDVCNNKADCTIYSHCSAQVVKVQKDKKTKRTMNQMSGQYIASSRLTFQDLPAIRTAMAGPKTILLKIYQKPTTRLQ